jgi:hypothetical protein
VKPQNGAALHRTAVGEHKRLEKAGNGSITSAAGNSSMQTGGSMSTQANGIQTHRFDYATPANPADFNPADFVEKAVPWVKSLVKPG